jgi:hypothetical protein
MIVAAWKHVLASALAGCASALMARGIPSVMASPGLSGAIVRIEVVSFLFVALYVTAVALYSEAGCHFSNWDGF